ncbi:membrane-associated protein, putative, partial [Bodo saltans]
YFLRCLIKEGRVLSWTKLRVKMRSTSLGLAVFALCTVMSVVLWLGGNDSGSGRLSVVTTSAAPVAEEQRFDADEVSRSDHHHWQWTGGGVRGLSEGGENIALDNVSATLRAAFIDLFNVPMFHFDLRHVSRTAPHIITRFRRLFMSFAVNSNDDCLIRMDPFKQLQCHLWANKLNSAVGAERSTIFSGVPLSSLCSLYLSCSLWKRGRHGIQLTPALLQGVFRTLQQDDELRNSSQLMLRNVIHG